MFFYGNSAITVLAGDVNRGLGRALPQSTPRLIRSEGNPPTHNGRDRLPGQLPPIKRCVPGFRARPGSFECPALLRIEDGHIGMTAPNQSSPAPKIEYACWAGREQLNNSAERDALFPMQLAD